MTREDESRCAAHLHGRSRHGAQTILRPEACKTAEHPPFSHAHPPSSLFSAWREQPLGDQKKQKCSFFPRSIPGGFVVAAMGGTVERFFKVPQVPQVDTSALIKRRGPWSLRADARRRITLYYQTQVSLQGTGSEPLGLGPSSIRSGPQRLIRAPGIETGNPIMTFEQRSSSVTSYEP